MMAKWLVILSLFILLTTVSTGSTDDPPFLFPHGYFDSAKLKPFDAIYLNLMAQSNLEYGGITIEELDKLDASRKVVPRPPILPRNREEDDVLLDRMPLDTDEIAPGSKSGESSDRQPSRPFSNLVEEMKLSGSAHKGEVTLKTTSRPPSSGFVMTAPESKSPQAKPMGDRRDVVKDRMGEDTLKKPPSPFRLVRLQKRIRRASDVDEENPFEEISTRSPPRDQIQLQLVRKILRKTRHKKKKPRFLTRDDIYDPQRNARKRLTPEDRRKLREELALKPESNEKLDGFTSDDVTTIAARESIGDRHQRRPQQAPTDEKFETDLRVTPSPPHMPTLVPTVDRAPRLPNNPFGELDIRKPTVVHLPIPPNIDENFER